MSAVLDTSVVIRYLTDDPPDLAQRAAELIDSGEPLLIPAVVLSEAAYVLTSVYALPRAQIVDHLIALMQKENIEPYELDKPTVLQALLLCRPSGRVSYPDALIWAAALGAPDKVVYSFDARFPSDGVTVKPPPSTRR